VKHLAETPAATLHAMIRAEKAAGNYSTEMCSGSEAGSYLRLIDFYHSTLGLRVIKKRRRRKTTGALPLPQSRCRANMAHIRQSRWRRCGWGVGKSMDKLW